MKTVATENEVNRVPADAITLSLQKLPYDGQDEADREMAEHFLLKGISSKVDSRLRKLDDKAKDDFKNGNTKPVLTKNYRREITPGAPRELFDLETFISKIVAKYPEVMAHDLRALANDSKKHSAAPLSIAIEYIGDVVREEKP